MKKIITWLTKGSKIVRILTYVYRGVFVSRRMLSSMLTAFSDVQPESANWKFSQTVKAVNEYLNVAEEALVKILNWIAPGTVEVENAGLSNSIVNLALQPKTDAEAENTEAQGEATADREAVRAINLSERGALLGEVLDGVRNELWDEVID